MTKSRVVLPLGLPKQQMVDPWLVKLELDCVLCFFWLSLHADIGAR